MLLVSGPPGAATARAAPEPATFRYVRDVSTIDRAAKRLVSEAADRGCDTVVFTFDLATFAPPPGRNEWTMFHTYRDDLPAWFAAIGSAAKSGRVRVFAATTASGQAVPVAGEWAANVRKHLDATWWDDDRFDEFPAAASWAKRLLDGAAGKRTALVYVTSEFPAERRVEFGRVEWRRKLADAGGAFDPERIGAVMADAGHVLLVCAPETRFGDDLPLQDLPDFPWAARPSAIGASGRGRARTERTGDTRRAREAIDPDGDAGRFLGRTPVWHRTTLGGAFHSDSPSGYGYWPYARAAARTGGAYVFYPFPDSPWLDVCPRDDPLVDDMAPRLEPVATLARDAREDPVVRDFARAVEILLRVTPWGDDGGRGDGGSRLRRGLATSWFAFQGNGRRADRWFPRDKPHDDAGFVESVSEAPRAARQLREALGAYDDALEILAETARGIDTGAIRGVSRRSRANLRLARFHLEMSAFHLEAAANCLGEVERFLPGPAAERFRLDHVATIKLSDCLDAYDGRTLPVAAEAKYGPARWWADLPVVPGIAGGGSPGARFQGNTLAIPRGNPDYRAKRELDSVLLRLDPRLVPRALRMVSAASEVMRHDARSGWGWVTYYTDAHTFDAVEVREASGPSSPIPPNKPVTDEPPPGPTTPRGGGSSGGGASTK